MKKMDLNYLMELYACIASKKLNPDFNNRIQRRKDFFSGFFALFKIRSYIL